MAAQQVWGAGAIPCVHSGLLPLLRIALLWAADVATTGHAALVVHSRVPLILENGTEALKQLVGIVGGDDLVGRGRCIVQREVRWRVRRSDLAPRLRNKRAQAARRKV